MRDSAPPGDVDYLLREIQVTPLRFRVKSGVVSPSDHLGAEVVACVRAHPGAHMNDLLMNLPSLAELGYEAARRVVVRLVDEGTLEPAGLAPLEELDLRYERVPACDLCEAPSGEHPIVFWKHCTPVVRCWECDLLYANPRWKADYLFGGYDSDYWATYAEKARPFATDLEANQRRWDPFLDTLGIAQHTGRLLDVGCATGEFLVAAKARDWELFGVEPSIHAAEQAARATGSSIHAGTLDSAPFPDGWFDVVTLWDVIEHVQSPSAYVSRIARLVRPGGLLALTTPNIRSFAYRVQGRDWWVVGPNSHIFYFSPKTITRLLSGAGFQIHSLVSWAVEIETWEYWLKRLRLQSLAPPVGRAARPIADRLVMGDELYVVARRNEA